MSFYTEIEILTLYVIKIKQELTIFEICSVFLIEFLFETDKIKS